MHKKVIYLDANFWIGLAEVNLPGRTPDFVDLLKVMRQQKDKFICPASAVHLFEFQNIGDKAKKDSRVKLVDEFSDNLCVLPFFEVLEYEVRNAAVDFWGLGLNLKINIRDVALRPVYYLLGDFNIDYSEWKANFPETADEAIRESERLLMQMKFSDLMDTPYDPIKQEAEKKLNDSWASSLNTEKKKQLSPDKNGRERHFNGIALQLVPLLTAYIQRFVAETQCDPALITDFISSPHFKNIPSLNTIASWIAEEMAAPGRLFEGNDFEDWQHICAAMQCCNILATEKHARHIVSNTLKLETKYGVSIVSTPKQLSVILATL